MSGYARPEAQTVVAREDGSAMLRVGRADGGALVRLEVLGSTLRMGPNHAVAVAEALLRHANSLLAERGPSPSGMLH